MVTPAIQKQDHDELPPVPNYRLNTGPLRFPGLAERRLGGFAGRLRLGLDPDIQLAIFRQRLNLLDPERIRAAIIQLLMEEAVKQPLGLQGLSQGVGSTSAASAGSKPPPQPSPFETFPRRGTAGDMLKAALQEPYLTPMVTRLKRQGTQRLEAAWGSLGSTGQGITIGVGVGLAAAGTLAMTDRDVRARTIPVMDRIQVGGFSMLDAINNRVIPFSVAGVPMGAEWNFQPEGNHAMFGIHLDIGSMLPASMGFGPASFQAIGGPPGIDSATPGR